MPDVQVAIEEGGGGGSVGGAVTIDTGDAKIGAVEIQDATDATRADVLVANTATGAENALATTAVVQGAVASSATDSGNPVKVGGVFNTVAPTIANAERGDLQIDASANLMATLATLLAGEDIANNVLGVITKPAVGSGYSGTAFAAFGADVDISVKATAGNLLSVTVSNINAAVRYLQIHNKASAPVNPNVPIFSVPVPAGTAAQPGSVTLGPTFWGEHGYYLATGIAIGVSTTNGTFTAATTTDHNVNGTFV